MSVFLTVFPVGKLCFCPLNGEGLKKYTMCVACFCVCSFCLFAVCCVDGDILPHVTMYDNMRQNMRSVTWTNTDIGMAQVA